MAGLANGSYGHTMEIWDAGPGTHTSATWITPAEFNPSKAGHVPVDLPPIALTRRNIECIQSAAILAHPVGLAFCLHAHHCM